VPTPGLTNKEHDLSYIREAARLTAESLKGRAFERLIVVEKSTVPVKTCEFVKKIFVDILGVQG
jgi:UDP-glucose 6-dehydrogenase